MFLEALRAAEVLRSAVALNTVVLVIEADDTFARRCADVALPGQLQAYRVRRLLQSAGLFRREKLRLLCALALVALRAQNRGDAFQPVGG